MEHPHSSFFDQWVFDEDYPVYHGGDIPWDGQLQEYDAALAPEQVSNEYSELNDYLPSNDFLPSNDYLHNNDFLPSNDVLPSNDFLPSNYIPYFRDHFDPTFDERMLMTTGNKSSGLKSGPSQSIIGEDQFIQDFEDAEAFLPVSKAHKHGFIPTTEPRSSKRRLPIESEPPRKRAKLAATSHEPPPTNDINANIRMYHKDTRVLKAGDGPAPYRDLPDDEYYAPRIPMRWYKKKCSEYCGTIIPSKVAAGKKPEQPKKQRTFVGEAVMHCVICGIGYGAYDKNVYHLEIHFPTCVERNGNPNGYH
ncbi:MAG: hypothetical protein Q9218_006737, partial [Villophora microphyllina]